MESFESKHGKFQMVAAIVILLIILFAASHPLNPAAPWPW